MPTDQRTAQDIITSLLPKTTPPCWKANTRTKSAPYLLIQLAGRTCNGLIARPTRSAPPRLRISTVRFGSTASPPNPARPPVCWLRSATDPTVQTHVETRIGPGMMLPLMDNPATMTNLSARSCRKQQALLITSTAIRPTAP